ncbi:hypothetical protein NA57DRAFT_70123 [Rhizodiscina lignyota]|uniref:RelA/SpoT domain-containing protein n=1 Tax=Rhizodiscina lignyota TaxID=1504668 RepID=A0A9P4ILU5_9PEZI|nr:hypothetical protein NA57DRAFT_70123 [Rhizodiscina lignyota]
MTFDQLKMPGLHLSSTIPPKIRKGKRRNTDPRTNTTIVGFMETYADEWRSFAELAEKLEEHCRELLKERGILCIVTSRAKKAKSLQKKLDDRASESNKVYHNPQAIYDDIVDIAGVRIALYYPNDGETVEELLVEEFKAVEVKVKVIDSPPTMKLDASTTDYRAHHYRLRSQNWPMLGDNYKSSFSIKVRAEIQVASVVHHVWQEVAHDLLYKKMEGDPTPQEKNLLKIIHGNITQVEFQLNSLKGELKQRLSREETPFDNEHQLPVFLGELVGQRTDWTKAKIKVSNPDFLLTALQSLESDTRKQLKDVLHGVFDNATEMPKAMFEPGSASTVNLSQRNSSEKSKNDHQIWVSPEGKLDLTIAILDLLVDARSGRQLSEIDRTVAGEESLYRSLSLPKKLDRSFSPSNARSIWNGLKVTTYRVKHGWRKNSISDSKLGNNLSECHRVAHALCLLQLLFSFTGNAFLRDIPEAKHFEHAQRLRYLGHALKAFKPGHSTQNDVSTDEEKEKIRHLLDWLEMMGKNYADFNLVLRLVERGVKSNVPDVGDSINKITKDVDGLISRESISNEVHRKAKPSGRWTAIAKH